MPGARLEDALMDNHDAIVLAAQARMQDDATMRRMAAQRELSESELTSQVLGFWLQAIRTDIALGSTAALAQNLGWLASLRAGQDLPFENRMVLQMFDDISEAIEARLDSAEMCSEYAAYRSKVVKLISDAFPH